MNFQEPPASDPDQSADVVLTPTTGSLAGVAISDNREPVTGSQFPIEFLGQEPLSASLFGELAPSVPGFSAGQLRAAVGATARASVSQPGSQTAFCLKYKTRSARMALFMVGAFLPVWGLWLPFALKEWGSTILAGGAASQTMLLFGLGVDALVFVAIALWAILDNRLVIDSQGIKFPIRFVWSTGLRRKFAWTTLQSVVYRGNEQEEWRSELELRFSDAAVPLLLGGFSKEDLRKLVFAAQTNCDGAPDSSALSAPPTFTQLWEDELASRFSPTVFVPLQPGTRLLNDRIEIIGQSASGGLSAIYIGRLDGEQKVVVKEVVTPQGVDDQTRDKVLELFAREAQLMKMVDHPRVAKLLDYFSEDSRHYLVLEHLPGVDLRKFLRENGRQHEGIVLRWAIEIADVLDHLHSCKPPIVHRDITPDNLIFTADGGISVIDFGAANALISQATGTLIGKQNYMAPEQFKGHATPQSDLYSLGCTIYFLLTGMDPEPLTVSHPQLCNPNVSDQTDRVVEACTTAELSERIESASVLSARLHGILNMKRSATKAGL